MNNRRIFYFFTFIFALPTIVNAQSAADSISISINPYASFRGNLAVYNKEVDLQDNVTRFGAKTQLKKGKISFLAATELRLNLFQGGASFNIDDSPSGEFLNVQTTTNSQTISNRLGYIGFDFEEYGTITFGKQWSVYYDITSYTNQFDVFGGTATATYIGGTDGGENGTGRVNQSVIYRNKFGRFYLGAQTQIRGANNDKLIDGFGFSGQLEITKEVLIGAAFNRALLSDNLINNGRIINLKGQPSYYALGLNYKGEKLTLSAVGAIEKNGDFAKGSFLNNNNEWINPTVVFDAKGFEFYSNYSFNNFSIHAGYNLYIPNIKNIKTENDQSLLSKDFKINDIIFGTTYQPIKYIQLYAEQRISNGRSASNQKQWNVFALGMTLSISKAFNTKVSAK